MTGNPDPRNESPPQPPVRGPVEGARGNREVSPGTGVPQQVVSEQVVQSSWSVAAGASATASLACVPTWHEDFRKDLSRIDVPTLVIHGDADRIVPFPASGQLTAKLVRGARLVWVKDGPHCIIWTHSDEVNAALLDFLKH